MRKSKQYDVRVIQDKTGWMAEIIRRVTTKKTVVSTSQDGFSTESEAQEWGQGEVKTFLQKRNLSKGNKRRSRQPE